MRAFADPAGACVSKVRAPRQVFSAASRNSKEGVAPMSVSRSFLTEQASAEPNPSTVQRTMTREQVVERIMLRNPSATPAFLGPFDDEALQVYLQRLEAASEPRGRRAVWVRRGSSSAIHTARRRR